ncbi:chorismate lyase [Methylococcus sp. EFPC2]|uniref:chorismate--pyruvate lyase family protein n=1 Tax=Methylococcus sp. EFPC2 TaxID=2812648 RepID=UPI0019683750|nr:chorismate lyase [Methylococcus sp. EFPC2]QSA97343.1 chorismate lyase [Methylococcus sp. EFPC2]
MKAYGLPSHPYNLTPSALPIRSLLFQREPQWVPAHVLKHAYAPTAAGSWIEESGSLTARLRRIYGGGFGVKVLGQRWNKPYPDEIRILGLAWQRHTLVREVLLQDRGQALVAARSIIPREALRGMQCRLAHLGNRPLGELLFAYPRLARLSLEVSRIEPSHWRPDCLGELAPQGEIWGRRSVYAVASGQILVCEFFLPALITPT